jgi:hypothetical protein
MVLHLGTHGFQLSHTEGCFGVTFNDITKDTTFYTTTSIDLVFSPRVTSRNVRTCILSKDDLQDSSSWSSCPILFLRES